MTSRTCVQNTPNREQLYVLHGALLDIVATINRPQVDAMMIEAAGIQLDRALFPLLVRIGRLGPIGVVELADRVGRDHTTVSRQVAKLESLGLITREASAEDRRIREAVLTPTGKAMTDQVDTARERIFRAVFADWTEPDVAALVTLMRRFADAMTGGQN